MVKGLLAVKSLSAKESAAFITVPSKSFRPSKLRRSMKKKKRRGICVGQTYVIGVKLRSGALDKRGCVEISAVHNGTWHDGVFFPGNGRVRINVSAQNFLHLN